MNRKFGMRDKAAVKGAIFMLILVASLLCFEIFNYSTTEYALWTFVGDLNFVGIPWSILLALAFCACDFGGVARILTPQKGKDEPKLIWLLMAAWVVAAFFNAFFTWWAVASAMALRSDIGNEVLGRTALITWIPVLVACIVVIIRFALIGVFTVSLDNPNFFKQSQSDQYHAPQYNTPFQGKPVQVPKNSGHIPQPQRINERKPIS